MIPKQKATELSNLYWPYTDTWQKSIVLAIICVDEIIKANPRNPEVSNQHIGGVFFWQQVKEELKKMQHDTT